MHGCNKCTERIFDEGVRMVQRRGAKHSTCTFMRSHVDAQMETHSSSKGAKTACTSGMDNIRGGLQARTCVGR